MNEIFKHWGIKHLSHSNIDLARNDLGLWVLRYIFRIYDQANAAMARGNAVEHGLQVALQGGEFDDPLDAAMKDFNKRTALGVDAERREKEAKNIGGMVAQAREGMAGATVIGYQEKIEIEIPGIDIPVIGYTDFTCEDTIIDLKTTTRLPSAISASHRRQGSVYQRAAGNKSIDFLYATPKKHAMYRLENSDKDWLEVCETARRLQRWLAKFDSKDELVACAIPNYDSFYWSSPATREKAREIFGY
jgi:hypothetical protein